MTLAYGTLIISNFQVQNCTYLRGKLNSIYVKTKKQNTYASHFLYLSISFCQKGNIFQFYPKYSFCRVGKF